MQSASGDATPRRVIVDPRGPLLVEGPVDLVLEDGTTVRSDRFMTAVCTCRRSRAYPFCDTSHRRRRRAGSDRSGADRADAQEEGRTP